MSSKEYLKKMFDRIIRNKNRYRYSFFEFSEKVIFPKRGINMGNILRSIKDGNFNAEEMSEEKSELPTISSKHLYTDDPSDKFRIYMEDTSDDNKKYYLSFTYYPNSQFYQYKITSSVNKATYFTLDFYNKVPFIKCLGALSKDEGKDIVISNLPKPYLYLNKGNKQLELTNDLNTVYQQSLDSFYFFFNDTTFNKLVSEYEMEGFMMDLAIYGGISFAVLIVLIIVLRR